MVYPLAQFCSTMIRAKDNKDYGNMYEGAARGTSLLLFLFHCIFSRVSIRLAHTHGMIRQIVRKKMHKE